MQSGWRAQRRRRAGRPDRVLQRGRARRRASRRRERRRTGAPARSSRGIVSVMAWVGTSSSRRKQPSSTCCWRQTSSSSTILDRTRIVEIGDRRIVEGDMPVDADAQHHDVDRRRGQRFGVAVGSPGHAWLDAGAPAERQRGRTGRLQPVGEALRRTGRQADILVHVEGRDPRQSMPSATAALERRRAGWARPRRSSAPGPDWSAAVAVPRRGRRRACRPSCRAGRENTFTRHGGSPSSSWWCSSTQQQERAGRCGRGPSRATPPPRPAGARPGRRIWIHSAPGPAGKVLSV